MQMLTISNMIHSSLKMIMNLYHIFQILQSIFLTFQPQLCQHAWSHAKWFLPKSCNLKDNTMMSILNIIKNNLLYLSFLQWFSVRWKLYIILNVWYIKVQCQNWSLCNFVNYEIIYLNIFINQCFLNIDFVSILV